MVITKYIDKPPVWNPDFPTIYGHTSVAYLKSRHGYVAAKCGDMCAASEVVNMCVKPERIDELRNNHPGAALLPVMTTNRLPEAFANRIGMRLHRGVCEHAPWNRKSLNAMERMVCKPFFTGNIKENESYIIVDDIVTQGGTVAALRKYVMHCGGTVAAVAALACSAESGVIAPDKQDIRKLVAKYPYSTLIGALREHEIIRDLRELTRPQIKYLLRFKNTEKMLSKLSQVHNYLQ